MGNIFTGNGQRNAIVTGNGRPNAAVVIQPGMQIEPVVLVYQNGISEPWMQPKQDW
jgi:hypothetical protein